MLGLPALFRLALTRRDLVSISSLIHTKSYPVHRRTLPLPADTFPPKSACGVPTEVDLPPPDIQQRPHDRVPTAEMGTEEQPRPPENVTARALS